MALFVKPPDLHHVRGRYRQQRAAETWDHVFGYSYLWRLYILPACRACNSKSYWTRITERIPCIDTELVWRGWRRDVKRGMVVREPILLEVMKDPIPTPSEVFGEMEAQELLPRFFKGASV